MFYDFYFENLISNEKLFYRVVIDFRLFQNKFSFFHCLFKKSTDLTIVLSGSEGFRCLTPYILTDFETKRGTSVLMLFF